MANCNWIASKWTTSKIKLNVFCFELLFFIQFFTVQRSLAQNIPIGTWESHFSYLSAQHVVEAENWIFCSTHNGLFKFDPESKETKIISKAEGLNEAGISSMAYNATDKTLILAYRTGNIDLLQLDSNGDTENTAYWPVFKDALDLPATKIISKIVINDNLTYLATNFGIIVLDTKLRQVKESYRYIGENGTELKIQDIAFANDSLYAISNKALLKSSMNPAVNRQYFANWTSVNSSHPIEAIGVLNDKIYAGFTGKGLFQKGVGSWREIYSSESKYYSIRNSNNAILATLDTKLVEISESGSPRVVENPLITLPKEFLSTESKNIWIADGKNGLISDLDGDFKSYSLASKDTTILPRADSSVTDLNGLLWARLPAALSGGISVKNPQSNQQRILSTTMGNGGLPSSTITSLALDQDGYVWFSSDKGVGYFIPDEVLSGGRIDAILPVYGQRRLFSNEKSNALAVEPGNRKWIGTNTGLYLFNADGTELVSHFTSDDSPLPIDEISALKHDTETGILYIETPNGLVSYRTGSTISSEELTTVTIFPNPVRPGYSGQIGIKGLIDKSTVKITTLSGKLVFETKSEGGTATWNLSDYQGNRAKGGIYMVLVNTPIGDQKFAGKLAIID